ncbi:hypothetical protein DPM13_09970 [Paracoccus mutanolyticus]|uniref:Uncharacterized protein n=1 Tax=Paracoccus mutanolyticus TaxID=1499308 RepID=A0ABM6WUW4_9RHOB|nr:hypothetical protein [Paracoccus mutanolyticus]AWX94455.1 hypothetical protein DPM13_09970 [Paracoccus mutanolyticus]
MTRHIADKSHDESAGRLRHYLRHEREEAVHPAILALRARPREAALPASRARNRNARIERGHRV